MKKTINESFEWEKCDVEGVKKVYPQIEEILKKDLKYVLDLKDEELNFLNLFKKTESSSAKIQKSYGVLGFFENIHTDKEMREQSRLESLKIGELLTKHSYNEDVYKIMMKFFNGSYKKEKKNLSYEEVKIVEDTIKGYKKMGMHLPKSEKEKIIKISNKLNKLSSEYQLNATKNYSKGAWFKKEELDGVNPENLKNFKFSNGKYFVSIRPTEIAEVKKYCTNKNTRTKITEISESGVGEVNNKKMREILKLRSELAKILGYKTWGHLTMSEQMVSDPASAVKFCTDLIKNLQPKFKKEFAEAKIYLSKGEKLDTTNSAFIENLAKTKNVDIDGDELKKYFEFENTIKSMFDIWEKYFDVKVEFMKNLDAIHGDIKVYKCSDKKTKAGFGTIILDLHPREGKYGHACVSSLSPRYFDGDGNLHTTTGVLICNFTKSASGKSFMTIENVSTLFHEGGHLLHKILSKNNYLSSSAFSTSIDFVEIPSQFLEHFPTDIRTANLVAKHVDTARGFDKNILQKIDKLDDYFRAYMWTRLCVLSLYDLEIHGKNILKYANKKGEMNKLFESLWKKYIGTSPTKNRNFSSNFSHLVGGYDSKYFGYGVSRVYAEDVWQEFLNKNKKVAYKKMLEEGNKKEEKQTLKEFLGRNPKQDAFLKTFKR